MLSVAVNVSAQTKQDTLEQLFSAKEIGQLQKGDALLNQGLNMDVQLDSLIHVYKNSEGTSTKLSNSDKNKRTNSLRALRVYYVGMSKKSDVYLKHINNNEFENKHDLDIDKLLHDNKANSKKAHKYFKQSRDTRQVNDALKYAVLSIDLHQSIQSDLYNQLCKNQFTETLVSKPIETQVSTTSPVSEAVVTVAAVEEISKPEIDLPIKKDTVVVLEEKKVPPPKETIAETTGPEVYFTIQIMADRKPATNVQLSTIYKGNRKTIENKGDGWYRYSVGKFNEYQKAYSCMKDEKIKGYVVAYHGSQRISTSEAKALLKSTP